MRDLDDVQACLMRQEPHEYAGWLVPPKGRKALCDECDLPETDPVHTRGES